MRLKKMRPLLFFVFFIMFNRIRGQLLTDVGEYHNQVFVGSGYTESFANTTYGINHQRYFSKIKRDITGILDFTSPLSYVSFTRFIFRKGIQVDMYKKHNFRLPIALVTSSVKK